MAPERQPADLASTTSLQGEASGRADETSTSCSEEAVKRPTISTESDTVEVERPTPGCPIIGLVASAGGLNAFRDFFGAMAAASGAAFVLIPHLDPTHESLMVELIGRQTTMPVVEATEGLIVEADHVYVLPPNKYMTVSEGSLHLTGPVERRGVQTSIDLFLRSLADDKREKAICIVLSGTGAHGTLGLKAVKAAGGMGMAQDPKTAEYPAMPQNAVATGLVDFVLPVPQMPDALIGYIRRFFADGTTLDTDDASTRQELERILDLLRAHAKFDFRCYRPGMLRRRIERRRCLGQFTRLADYGDYLAAHPEEVKRLFQDLLISVTNFFRNPDAFRTLEAEVLVPLIRSKQSQAAIRVWSAGCATGEEAYSLGMLLLEQLGVANKSCPVKVFATDVDDVALDFARKGIYPETISTDVSVERLQAFFTKANEASYQVGKPLRETVTFARQNLISDAPFSQLDLIVCRNVLIYLEPEIQRKVIALFHFALDAGGCLFLGPSETIGPHTDLFEPISKTHRIYRRIGPARSPRVEVPIATAAGRQALSARRSPASPPASAKLADLMRSLLLENFAPAAVLIDRRAEILYTFGSTDRYLTIPSGEPTRNLMLLAREGLRSHLRSAIDRALQQQGAPVVLADVRVIRPSGSYFVIVTVRAVPLPTDPEGLLLMTFQDDDRSPPSPSVPVAKNADEESALRRLQSELMETGRELQDTVRDLEQSNEDLKASNEEIMSMNEELQSANEELETSKEELQSLNEELTTANGQLQEKVADLESANNDVANLLRCSEAAIVFLDGRFRIKRYTPHATKLFGLIPTDLERPLNQIAPNFIDDALHRDIEQVYRHLAAIEKPVRTADGTWWNRRITPYRTRDDRIDGVVLTFYDVTRIRIADEQARRLAAVLRDSNDAVVVHDLEGKITAWNRGAEQMLGYREAEALTMNCRQFAPEGIDELEPFRERLLRGERVVPWEAQRRTKDGRVLDVYVSATTLRDEEGHPVAVATTERDVTEQRQTRLRLEDDIRLRTADLRKSQEHLIAILDSAQDAIITIDAKGIIQSINKSTERIFGYAAAEMLGQNVKMLMPAPQREEHDRYLAEFGRTGASKILGVSREVVARRKDGSVFPADVTVNAVDHLGFFTGLLRDITQRKQAESALRESERFARSTLDGLAAHIAIIDDRGIILAVNQAWKNFAEANGAVATKVHVGADYLSACERSVGLPADEGSAIAAGIRAVLEGKTSEFMAEYSCPGPQEQHWFLMRVSPFPGEGPRRAVIAHEDISKRKELEREVVEIASLEQRRIGQDLHDSVGQELTALGMLVGDLARAVQTDPASVMSRIERISDILKSSRKELRAVLRGLLPVAVDTEGLMASLSDLADRIRDDGKSNCVFECPEPVAVADNLVATHLYLIAQEAVHNAVKHARAKNIRLFLKADDVLELAIQDDGGGMPLKAMSFHGGLGLRIMKNRAAIVGAMLTIEPAAPSGTVVTCRMARKRDES